MPTLLQARVMGRVRSVLRTVTSRTRFMYCVRNTRWYCTVVSRHQGQVFWYNCTGVHCTINRYTELMMHLLLLSNSSCFPNLSSVYCCSLTLTHDCSRFEGGLIAVEYKEALTLSYVLWSSRKGFFCLMGVCFD